MDEVKFRQGKVRIQSETETEYDTDHPEVLSSSAAQAPEIVQPLKDFRLMEGNDVTFVAKVTGNPRPKVCVLLNYRDLNLISSFTNSFSNKLVVTEHPIL